MMRVAVLGKPFRLFFCLGVMVVVGCDFCEVEVDHCFRVYVLRLNPAFVASLPFRAVSVFLVACSPLYYLIAKLSSQFASFPIH